MSYIIFLLSHLLDLPKTIWFNLRVLPLYQAIKFPILISHRVKIGQIYKECIEIKQKVFKPFMIKIGIEGVDGVSDNRRGYLLFGKNAKIIFNGKAALSKGISIRNSGTVSFGENFYCNCNMSIICSKKVSFGDDCILGWSVHIRDCDGHSIFQNGERINPNRDVQIGNHVWIGQDVKILKGSVIPENSVIAMNSCVTKCFTEPKTIIGGYPAKVIKQNVEWEV